MQEETITIRLSVYKEICTAPLTIRYQDVQEHETNHTEYKLTLKFKEIAIHVEESSLEYAIKNVQKALPNNISILSCMSCRHGNFNPYGDLENEIFCLKDITIRSKQDVIEMFETGEEEMQQRVRELLFYCQDYQRISKKEKYTYNDWC